MQMLISWLVLSLSIWLTAVILPGFRVTGLGGAIIVAAIFGVLNWLLGRLLFTMIGFGTLGVGFLLAFITRWVVNTLLLKLTDALSKSLEIRGWGTAFVGALLMSAFGTAAEFVVQLLMRA